MFSIFSAIWEWLLSLFWSQEMDITLIGLQNAGKTTLARVLAGGEFTSEYGIPLSTLLSIPITQPNAILHSYSQLEDTKLNRSMPTVGFNLKRIQAGHVTLNAWDIGGQPQYRTMWERYCLNSTCIVFVVDAADEAALFVAAEELESLLQLESLGGIPLLVLGNKSDLKGHVDVDGLIEALDLVRLCGREEGPGKGREVSCYGVSAKKGANLDAVIKWLVARAGK
ncbi:MAG: hypothetical protein Q9159_005323 [Coniocarpon cinnabarinum]